jgi:hypothetical protein
MRPKLEEKSSRHSPPTQDDKIHSKSPEKTIMFIGRPADEWKEAAADRFVQSADWLAGATSRLSERIATVASDDHVRENAVKAAGLVTGAGALIAQQARRIKPIRTYRATASYARNHPKTAVAGGVVAAAALYGAYRAYRNSEPAVQKGEAPRDN